MDVRNCRRCSKLFAYRNKPICPECERLEELDFEKVRDFVKENPGSSIPQITEATGVAGNMILRFLKDSRLEIIEGMSPLLACETCFTPIHVGRFCKECAKKISKRVSKSITPQPISKPVEDKEKKEKGLLLNKLKG